MKPSTSNFRLIAFLLIALFILLPSAAGAGEKLRKAKIKAVSYNLYVGADIFRVFAPYPCGIPQAVHDIHSIIQATDFPARAESIADQIMEQEPHVIGLQEVSLLRTQFPGNALSPDGSGIEFLGDFPTDPRFMFKTDAQDVSYDYLQLLLDALTARGLEYVPVTGASVVNADVELPAIEFDGSCQPLGLPMDVRLTDRDVILVRANLAVKLAMAANFSVNAPISLPATIPTPGGPVDAVWVTEFTRGWGLANVTIKDHGYNVLNTHLEVGDRASPPDEGLNLVQFAQAWELGLVITAPLPPGPRILVGDINSSPDSGITDPRPAYAVLTEDFDLTDLWNIQHRPPANEGFTCCQGEFLDNPASLLDERIDVIFADFRGMVPEKTKFYVLGGQPADATPSGLWPSDHAGVAAKISFER